MHFDPTISLGNIFTIIAAVFGFYKVWKAAITDNVRRDEMLKAHQKWMDDHAVCNRKQMEVLIQVQKTMAFLEGFIQAKDAHHAKD